MQQSTQVRDAYVQLCEASMRGDIDALKRLFSRQAGTLAIGTDPNEWWPGYDRMLQVWAAQIEALGGSLPIVAGDPQAYQEGTVGWVADQPKMRLPDGEMPFRMTCVFHQEDGAWKLVQAHGSLGVPNQEMVGEELGSREY
jgi:ketosteroid isomerase-like protein